ncbi:MAG: 16S rRNA (guanine(527)-N(7))-methyltransferase RsmG [Parafannyhessea sp.]|uniref:16S rRNA (guanine(527)-N(7))-methyltransferase RsmG n=1 Tax=Parafannyhessea sp. TaxID=2847324 RepID=UPI003EFD12B0
METNISRIISEAGDFDISVTEQQAESLLKHVLLVNEKNKNINLTRITSIEDAIDRHIVDSILYLKAMDSFDASLRLCDIGTGAGFPGVPLAIMTNFQVDMIDSVGKKVRCVESFIQDLNLSNRCNAMHVRVEDFARDHSKQYDYVTARAVASLRVLLEYSAPLLKIGGFAVASKGNLEQQELDEALRTAKICGMRIVTRETYELPHESGHREILKFEKYKQPSVHLPRRTGEAKLQPLY